MNTARPSLAWMRRRSRVGLLLAATALMAVTGLAQRTVQTSPNTSHADTPRAAAEQTGEQNPYASPEDVAAGAKIFRSHCAECHGREAEGGRGPALTGGVFRHGGSDTALFNTIKLGVPGTEMPGIYYEGKQIWQVVAFVRSLSRLPQEAPPSGDPARGEALYLGKGGCNACHLLRGQGGRLGPALDTIASRRSVSNLKASLLRPDAQITRGYTSVQARTAGGQTASGVRLNEDMYSLQMMDMAGNLHSLPKKDLREITYSEKSLMPSYEGRFSDGELEDLLSYLYSLRTAGRPQ
jgi:putative heme-binding domain-containing protein